MNMDRQEVSRQVAEYCLIRGKISNLYEDFAKTVGVPYFSMYVLYFIYQEGDTCTQKIICEKTLLPKQTVNAIITSFLKKKILELSETKEDRRVKYIRLTKSGKKYVDKFIPKIIDAELDAMEKMTSEQRASFVEATRLYGEHLRECLQKAKETLSI
jgi:DNA-binding MarR family transcriptional regulator